MLRLGELLEQRLRRVKLKGQCRLVHGHRGGLLTHLLALEISLKSIEEKTIMRYAVPVKHLLLLLCANAIVLVKEVQERALWFFERGVGARLQVTKVGKDAFFELLGVLDRPAERLETEGKASYDIGTGDVEEVVPVWRSASWPGASACCRLQTYHSTQDTYSPVGSKKRLMYWS